MKRNYRYEKEMLHWLDGGEIEQKFLGYPWEPFCGIWADSVGWDYRIVEPTYCEDEGCDHYGTEHICVCVSPTEKLKEERWLYVYSTPDGVRVSTVTPNLIGCETIGKIRMEDV